MASRRIHPASWLVTLGAALVIPQTVYAQGEPAAPAPNDRDPVAIYVQSGATPEQVQKIRELSKEFEDMGRVRWQSLMNLNQKMRELSFQPDPDEKAVISTQDEINKAISDMSAERIKLMLKIRGMLTPEQKERLVALMKERQTRAATPQGTR